MRMLNKDAHCEPRVVVSDVLHQTALCSVNCLNAMARF